MNRPENRLPDFNNLAAVLEKRCPARPTLFDFFLNERLYHKLAGDAYKRSKPENYLPDFATLVYSFENAGYDYAMIPATRDNFVPYDDSTPSAQTVSLNAHSYVCDRESFSRFAWLDPEAEDLSEFAALGACLPQGMKVIPYGPGGVLENVISITGYENLCMMIYDDEQLVYDLFEKVGSTLLRVYERVLSYPFVGALMSNDDWGFNTQTMLSPADMRRFVFPWHKRIVQLAHSKGLYALLHSCGNFNEIIEDVITDMQYDGRHSYEDKICPVEEAYEKLKGCLAILGGLDMHFMATESPENIRQRAAKMLQRAQACGGYALGTGNSVPEYIPDENYFSMTQTAWENEGTR